MLEHRFAKLAAAATFALPAGPEPTLGCERLSPPEVCGVVHEHGPTFAVAEAVA